MKSRFHIICEPDLDFESCSLTEGLADLLDEAKEALAEVTKLALGTAAPEIDGVDVDGVNFKLSDYRGKVVLLDFWGFW